MKKLLVLVMLLILTAFFGVVVFNNDNKQITDGRFNSSVELVEPEEQEEPEDFEDFKEFNTTTTIPSYEDRWPHTPEVRQPTPFEPGVPSRVPTGCEEGEERRVDC